MDQQSHNQTNLGHNEEVKDEDIQILEDEIEKLPIEKREELMRTVSVSKMYSGPLPPPEYFEKYEMVQTGAADRILKLAENEQQHRIVSEQTALKGQIESEKRGQIMSFVLCLAAFGISFTLIMLGKSIEGFISMLVPIGVLIKTFFIESRADNKDPDR